MAAITTYPVYDPWAKETPRAEHVADLRLYNQRCYALVKKIYDRNEAAGKRGPELFWAVGIHREQKGRSFTFNVAMPLKKHDIFPADHGVRDYGGAMGQAETLLNGEWRIATIEEEAECKRQDAETHNAIMVKRDKVATRGVAAMIETMAKQVMGPVTPSPAGAKGR